MRHRIIYESILDDIDAKKSDSASDASASLSNASSYDYYIDICIRKLYTEEMQKSGLKMNQIRELDSIIVGYASTLPLFTDFSVTFSKSPNAVSAKYENFLPCEEFISKCANEFDGYLTNWTPLTTDGSICIRISYSLYKGNTFKMFADAVFGLLRVAYQIIFERFKFRSSNGNAISIELESFGCPYEYSIKDLDYGELKKVYSSMLGSEEGEEWKKAKYPVVYKLNTEGVRLAPGVHYEETVRLKPGDLIYFRKGYGLVLEAEDNDIPVALFVYKNQNDDSLRCVSLRFMSQVNPKNGSVRPCERISFGNFDNTIVTDGVISTSDGLEITDATIKYINSMEHVHLMKRPKFYQYDFCDWGNMPLFDIVMQFRTPGTKSGDWYVPAADEIKFIEKNIEYFDSVRNQNDIEEFPEWEYATALEIDDKHRVTFDMDLGQPLDDRQKKGHADECVVAFLKISLKQ